ncbi:MAG TPA: polysaccharide pyruvyl transferase CsaB [Desulfotomaculum sp.]|nr:MAG: Polysaccharide pyruvyl transferase [Desulfotomaculum sp. 46_296]HAG11219.1 polysaccharide pyruvyl transferase CsaB [Desulfotomaculum sp.]HBY03181.1 polysaccharide pyruvyl transferase CsaB [Desulfotomaculum sp.]
MNTAKIPGKPHLVISGYYGFDNAGDEAILLSLVTAFRTICPEVQLTVLSSNPSNTANLYHVQALNRWQPGEVYRALREADMLVSGGGSLLQDVTGLKSLVYYLGVVWLALKLKKPVGFCGQGVGPVTSGIGRRLMKSIADKVDLITVRDEQSANDLLEMGITSPPVYVTADPVFVLKKNDFSPEQENKFLQSPHQDNQSGKVQSTAGISIREWSLFNEKDQLVVAKLADHLSDSGWQIIFLPFHYPTDFTACLRVKQLMKSPAQVIDKVLTAREAGSIIGSLDLLIGMRLHSLILAAVAGVPFIGISYDPKIKRFLNQLGLHPAGEASSLEYSKCLSAVNEVISNQDAFKNKIWRAVEILQPKALLNARLALELAGTLKES